jgi:hypothetical protein
MSLLRVLLGRPLATEEDKAERIGPVEGVPIFGWMRSAQTIFANEIMFCESNSAGAVDWPPRPRLGRKLWRRWPPLCRPKPCSLGTAN